jgi:hypothetical protein
MQQYTAPEPRRPSPESKEAYFLPGLRDNSKLRNNEIYFR